MGASTDIHKAYSEWRRLAEAEGNGIRAGNWSFVEECQQALAQLRPTLEQLTHQARCDGAVRASDGAPLRTLRPIILELIELQRRNLAALHQRRERLSAYVEQLARTGRTLRRVQRSYATPPPSGWNSYS